MFARSILSLALLLFFFFSFQSLAYAGCNDTASAQFQSLCRIDVTDNMTLIRNIIQGLLVIASVACLVFLVYGGTKWVLSGGDKTKISEARGVLTAAVVGLIVTFLSFFIINVVSAIFGIQGGTIFVLPRLINEKPSLPINTEDKTGGSSGTGEAGNGPNLTQ